VALREAEGAWVVVVGGGGGFVVVVGGVVGVGPCVVVGCVAGVVVGVVVVVEGCRGGGAAVVVVVAARWGIVVELDVAPGTTAKVGSDGDRFRYPRSPTSPTTAPLRTSADRLTVRSSGGCDR
jgi:hypothetical protein